MYSNIKNKIKYILTISTLLIFFIINIQVAEAKVDNLRISVGYEGGPFYTKADFSFEDLRSGMSDHVYGFSHIKGNGALNYNFARGYTLEYLLNQMADIYIDSIKRAVIVTTDEYLVNNKDITREYLFRENRYFYPELYRYYGTPDEDKGRDRAEIVKPFIAVESNTIDFDTSTDKDKVGELIEESLAGEGLSDNTSFRLLLGANPDLKTNTARNTAQDIYEIKLVLEGAPTLEIQEEAIIRDSEIGGNVINEDGTLNIQNGDIIDVDNLFDWKVEDVNYDDDEIRYNIEMAAKEQVEKAITNVYGKDAKPKFHTDFNIEAVEVLEDGRIRVKDASKLNLNTMYRSDYGFEHAEDGSGIRKDILNIKKDGKVGSEIFRNNSEVGTDEIVQGDSKYIYRGSNPPPNSVTPDPKEPNPDSNNNESENNKPDSEKPGNDKPGNEKPG
ncbi:MAG: hypothetical protein Q4P31_07410, partial [Andreesenia angusta]|nr:hypothetical protein [Andreesenia angusta]